MALQPPKAFPPPPPDVRVDRAAPTAVPTNGAIAADLAALIITFQRPDGFQRLVDSLVGQTVRPARVVVVDNGREPAVLETIRRLTSAGCTAVLVTPPRNIGPAGATALAMTLLLAERPPAEWLAIFNDDLVFAHPSIVGEMLAFARASAGDDPAVGAVGRIGHRFDRRWARLHRPPEADLPDLPPVIEVDYLTTGSARAGVGQPLPMFRLAAVRDVGPFWADLFIGMTEVEYGLRLRRGGYRLLANGTMWRQPRPPGVSLDGPRRLFVRTPGRRYYSARNLVAISRVYGRWWTPAWVTVSRLGARLVACLRRPGGESWRHLRATLRGLADGWRSRLGQRVLR